ncbi:MAG: RNA polymerase sigma factor RpoE [Magnetococcales bacterium]|nr:RNA polymerase sigma factor RpoE [Magnetococcales bacterium]
MVSDADRLLINKVKEGDTKAFELLVRKYQGRVASVISRTVQDPAKVQDLTQEAFLKAYRALANFRGDSAFYTWLFRIAVNTAKNHVMSAGRGVPVNDIEYEKADRIATQLQDHDTPERQVLRGEMLKNLQAVINGLPDAMKEAIILRDLEGKTYEEIAQEVSCPIGTVRSRIFRGRQEIIEKMQGYLKSGNGQGQAAH